MGRLSGKVAIVTGGAQGMGKANVRLMVREGAQVVLTDRNAAKGTVLANELRESALFVAHDVTKEEDLSIVAQAEAVFGPVNVLVNNAGIFLGANPFDRTVADSRKLIEVNQIGPFPGLKAVMRSMIKAGSGSIINISSIGGWRAPPTPAAIAMQRSRCAGSPRSRQSSSVATGSASTPSTLARS